MEARAEAGGFAATSRRHGPHAEPSPQRRRHGDGGVAVLGAVAATGAIAAPAPRGDGCRRVGSHAIDGARVGLDDRAIAAGELALPRCGTGLRLHALAGERRDYWLGSEPGGSAATSP